MKSSDSTQLIADTPPEQRPREKALRFGLKSLSDAELLALVLGTGIKGKGVTALCQDILNSHDGHLSRIAATSPADFISRTKGIGPAKALCFLAGIELGIRAAADAVTETPLSSSQKAFDYIHRHLYNLDHEEFWVVCLKQNLTPSSAFCASRGGVTSTVVDVKVIMRQALACPGCTALMLFHNHPSGNLRPSAQDDSLTTRITEAAQLLELRVLDHIIVGRNEYFSYHDEGKM